MRAQRASLDAVLATIAVITAGCDVDLPSRPVPATGRLQVTVTTTGVDLDSNGYLLRLGSSPPVALPVNGSVAFTVSPTPHVVELLDVAPNCAVLGESSRNVSVVADGSTEVAFSVTCLATPTVRVTARTTGADPDPSGYQLWMIREQGPFHLGTVPANGTAVLPGLAAGTFALHVRDVAANCDLDGDRSRSLELAYGDTALVAFDVACAPATQIAYAARGDIYVINSNGTGSTRLTHASRSFARNPAWSPDGRRIAFAQDRGDGRTWIYLMDSDGFFAGVLVTTAGGDDQPAWSPDGSRIAFAGKRDGNTDIYVMNIDGRTEVRLTDNAADDVEPAWSPDGSRIAFTSYRDGAARIYVMNADGSGATRLGNAEPAESPAWSPDGTRLAFAREVCDGPFCTSGIFVMNADGSGVRRIGDGAQPSWSGDGRRIAYTVIACDYYYYKYCFGNGIRIVHADAAVTVPTDVDVAVGSFESSAAWRW